MKIRRNVSLLVVELGASPSSPIEDARDGTFGRIVVAQQPSESAGQFAARVLERIRRLKRCGAVVVRAALACHGRCDADAIGGRCLLVRCLFAACPDLSESNLAIRGPMGNAALRHQHQAIVQTIREHELLGTLSGTPSGYQAPARAALRQVA